METRGSFAGNGISFCHDAYIADTHHHIFGYIDLGEECQMLQQHLQERGLSQRCKNPWLNYLELALVAHISPFLVDLTA